MPTKDAIPERPQLRPGIDAVPVEGKDGRRLIGLRDMSGLADGMIAVSTPALFIISLLDGDHTLIQVQADFARQFGQLLFTEQLTGLIKQLDDAHFLAGPSFDAYHQSLVDAYQAAPTRAMRAAAGIGVEEDRLAETLAAIIEEGECERRGGRIAGLIVPHLDLARGRPCYADGYRTLAENNGAERFVLLGTNHFGESSSVVATRKDFSTPLGTVPTDGGFLSGLERRLGADLYRHEFDHQREHSIEIQLLFLQQILRDDAFSIVPVLCPDPCGPTGTAPHDGQGVDLARFAEALRDQIANDPTPTCVVAGADMSHIGQHFGDERPLDDVFLKEVEQRDRLVLSRVEAHVPEDFRRQVAADGNPTRVCSAGCIYTLMTALPGGKPEVLRYHQAADPPSSSCVTCSAVAYWDA